MSISKRMSPNSREIISAQSDVTGNQEYLTSHNHALNINATFSASSIALNDGSDGSIKATVFDYTNANPLAVRLTDTSGNYVSPSGSSTPSVFYTGQQTVTTPGTAVAITTTTTVSGVIIQALADNVDLVFVGTSSASQSSIGFQLQPGQATSVAIDDLDKVFVDALTANDGVCWIGS